MTRQGMFLVDREISAIMQADQEPVSILDIFRKGVKESVEAGKQELWNKLFGGSEKVASDDELMGPPKPVLWDFGSLQNMDTQTLVIIGIILLIIFIL